MANLTGNPAADGLFSWRSDGESILFCSDRDSNPEIYLMKADGTGVTRLTDNPGVDLPAGWSSDGRRILVTSDRAGNPDIYTINGTADDQWYWWAPDCAQIYLTSFIA